MKDNDIIELLIIDSDDYSWYKKYINQNLRVYANKIEHYDNVFVYQHVDSAGVIKPEHGLTKEKQRTKKMNRIIKTKK
jgi:hypothetical protein